MIRKEEMIDRVESICEELIILTGWDVKVVNGFTLELDTLAGKVTYHHSEKTVMGDVYRFISHVGGKLQKWGLENKLKEYIINEANFCDTCKQPVREWKDLHRVTCGCGRTNGKIN